MPDGVYIRGSVQGYPILFTTDTGASKTIVSTRMYDAMRLEDQPALTKATKLIGASGSAINIKGKATFSLQIGSVNLQVEAIVAEIDDDGLLGVDVLQNSEEGPTDLLLSKGILRVDNKEVPVIQIGMKSRIRRVTAADHFIIPAESEAVIDVYVERKEYDDFSSETEYIIEPTRHFQEEYPLQMASTLVDINDGCTCKVGILNPYPTAMSLKQDAVLGKAEPIEGNSKILVDQENTEEVAVFTKVLKTLQDIRSGKLAMFTRPGTSLPDRKNIE